MTMNHIRIIDFNKLEIYEAGAMLLTHLAYPEKNISDDERGKIHATLCNWALRLRYNEDPAWSQSPQLIKPCYAFFDADEIAKILKTFSRRMRDRSVAGRMAMAFIMEATEGTNIKLPKGTKRVSLNEISTMVLEDASQSDPENVEMRIWRPSLPVIHICAAVQFIMQTSAKAGASIDFTDVLTSRELIEQIITIAEECESLLLASSKVKVDKEALLRFRITN